MGGGGVELEADLALRGKFENETEVWTYSGHGKRVGRLTVRRARIGRAIVFKDAPRRRIEAEALGSSSNKQGGTPDGSVPNRSSLEAAISSATIRLQSRCSFSEENKHSIEQTTFQGLIV